jgi:hypothetical protein
MSNSIDNFRQIEDLLEFPDDNTFYFIQLLKRKKENPEMKKGVRVINNYYVYSKGDLDKLRDRILEDCQKHNARAYINLNRLDSEKIALHTLKTITDYILLGDYKSVKNAYAASCGSHHSEKNKRWVVDIDADILPFKEEIRTIIEKLHEEIKGNSYKILCEVPTKSGVHIITNPFNLQKFKEIITDRVNSSNEALLKLDIHKNSPTILYVN